MLPPAYYAISVEVLTPTMPGGYRKSNSMSPILTRQKITITQPSTFATETNSTPPMSHRTRKRRNKKMRESLSPVHETENLSRSPLRSETLYTSNDDLSTIDTRSDIQSLDFQDFNSEV